MTTREITSPTWFRLKWLGRIIWGMNTKLFLVMDDFASVHSSINERYVYTVTLIGIFNIQSVLNLFQPLFELDMTSSVKYQKERKEYEKLLFASKKAKEDNEQREQVAEPTLKKFIVSYITPERLITIHQDKRGICLYVDELMLWFKNFNRYNSGSEEQFEKRRQTMRQPMQPQKRGKRMKMSKSLFCWNM